MSLVALIGGYRDSRGAAGTLRAALPLAGRCLIERQARLAAAAGASPVIILVERLPPELLAAVDRLRRDRIGIVVARNAEEAAAAVDPHQRLLLVADGLVTEREEFVRMAGQEDNAVLTLADRGQDERYERIDAINLWAGLAIVDGALLRETAPMLHEWDLLSTLLRAALQKGARLVPAYHLVAIVDSPGEMAETERAIVAGAEAQGKGWASRFLLAPIERMLAHALMPSPASPAMVGLGAAALTGLGALAFAWGHGWLGLLLLLVATPLEGTAERLSRMRLQPGFRDSWGAHLLPVLFGAALLALAYARMPLDGWGTIVLAVAAIAFLRAAAIEGEGRALPGELFLAEPKGMAWLMLPFAVAGQWTAGLAALFAYAAGSFFWVQHQVRSGGEKAKD